MAKNDTLSKRIQIDQANLSMVVVTSIAVFVTVFALIASYSLLGQRAYQAKVIGQKKDAKAVLDKNVKTVDSLVKSYRQFVETSPNIIAGISTGSGEKDGDNAEIILNALPSQYDFPAVTASLEKLITTSGGKIESISGTDNEAAAAAVAAPTPVEIPFEVGVEGNYDSLEGLLSVIERSIRPIQASKIQIEAADKGLILRITGKTYYQPPKTLNIQSKVVK